MWGSTVFSDIVCAGISGSKWRWCSTVRKTSFPRIPVLRGALHVWDGEVKKEGGPSGVLLYSRCVTSYISVHVQKPFFVSESDPPERPEPPAVLFVFVWVNENDGERRMQFRPSWFLCLKGPADPLFSFLIVFILNKRLRGRLFVGIF